MKKVKKTYFNWSSGKDSAMALHRLLQNDNFSIDHLLTSMNTHYDRVSMHGVRRELLFEQLNSINIPYSTLELPAEPTMEEYEAIIGEKMIQLKNHGFTDTAFGDIFLEDLRKYREEKLSTVGIHAHFPLWNINTTDLLHEFINDGFRSIVVCCNDELLGKSWVGREINEKFIKELPKNVDPCGENGEFHTFCFDGPIFKEPIRFELGEIIKREYPRPNATENQSKTVGFWFCDLLPINTKK